MLPVHGRVSVQQARESGSVTIELDEKSKAYVFDTGKSYFQSFELPTVRTPYRITIESYLLGDQMTALTSSFRMC